MENRPEPVINSEETFDETIDMLSKPCYMDKSGLRSTILYNSIKQARKSDINELQTKRDESVSQAKQYTSVMRSLAEKIRG